MSREQWAALWAFIVSGAGALYLAYVARNPSGARGGPFLVKALNSWFLTARWSDTTERRLWRMAVIAGVLALVMLYVVFFNPPTRYPR